MKIIKNHGIIKENHENHENRRMTFEIYLNHENPEFRTRIKKVMKIIKLYDRIKKNMNIL